ncbi:MAG: polyprenyl synthetase family protein [Oscillospiraceae bacterium]|nr:polyprenyl synthetase family protein [Oscillospiraceae bacterium]
MDYPQEYQDCRQLVERRLEELFLQPCPQKPLLEAMRYSLLAGGKRIRPVLCLQFCRLAGGEAQEALDFACGVELLHTYSLIHDDLPCMDNDALRRGKPTCHKKYGETVATLAGDTLQAAAFELVLGADGNAAARARAALALAQAAGEMGMCGGQYLDTMENNCTVEQLYTVHHAKTGALLEAACAMGVLASQGRREVPAGALEAAGEYAKNLGVAFQIQDDILDVTATTQALGKPAGSDRANEKTTFVTLLGVDACRELVQKYTGRAKEALGRFPNAGFLLWMADYLARRES